MPPDFSPRMPTIKTDNADLADVFLYARLAASNRNIHQFTLVTPEREVQLHNVPPREKFPQKMLERAEKIAPERAAPLNIAVIAYTDTQAIIADVKRTIPFVNYLRALVALGHIVWVFEGHADALAEGFKTAHIALVDEGMLPFLPPDWAQVARKQGVKRLIIWGRQDGKPRLYKEG